MNIKSINEIVKPLFNKWESFNYSNFKTKSDIMTVINSKNLIVNFNDSINEMFLEAFRNYDNLNFIIFFNKKKVDTYNFYSKYLSKNIVLYGLKNIKLCQRSFRSFILQLYYENDFSFDKIKDILKYITNNKNQKEITFTVLIFKEKNKKLLEEDIKKVPKYENIKVYIPQNKIKKIIVSSIIFSNSSINFLKKFDLKRFSKDFKKSKKIFMDYHNFLFEKINFSDHYKFMLYSSVILFLFGLREMNDLDIYVDNIEKSKTSNILNLIENKFLNSKKYDVSVKNTKYWPKYWNIWLKEWAQLSGTRSFQNIVVQPQYHFYFLGIKIISPEVDLQRRIKRQRPRAFADLIALKENKILSFTMPKIPRISYEYKSIDDIDNIEEHKVQGWQIKEDTNEMIREKNINKTKFLNTIKWCLETRYNNKKSLLDINNFINKNGIVRTKMKKIRVIKNYPSLDKNIKVSFKKNKKLINIFIYNK